MLKIRLPDAVSTSAPVSVIDSGVSSLVEVVCGFAVGASLTGLTVIDAVSVAILKAVASPTMVVSAMPPLAPMV